ncbi:hypothetical protein HRbin36_02819 [bacterium HR36]|nr:hypothetical protein HRbin36_02819 [bacterium HR36]
MTELLQVLRDLSFDFLRLLLVLANLIMRYALLLGWLAWWLGLVDWREFWPVLRRGGWVPLVLGFGLVSYLAWLLGIALPGATELGALAPIATCLALLASVLLCGWLQTVFAWYPVEISFETPGQSEHVGHGPLPTSHVAEHGEKDNDWATGSGHTVH